MKIEDIDPEQLPQDDPLRHVAKIHERLGRIVVHLREDIEKIDEPRAMALFETSAEVLEGLRRAYEDYVEKNEPAWKSSET